MTIEFPFEIGQMVWPIENRHEQYWKKCEACDGQGMVTLKNGSRSCPECYGRLGHFAYRPTKWMIAEGRSPKGELVYCSPMTIGQIRIEMGKNSDGNRIMLEETGVGSGTLWHAENIFATKQEAQDACDQRNNSRENE